MPAEGRLRLADPGARESSLPAEDRLWLADSRARKSALPAGKQLKLTGGMLEASLIHSHSPKVARFDYDWGGMVSLNHVALALSDAAGLLLICRLFSLRLQKVYIAFGLFVLLFVVSSTSVLLGGRVSPGIDYRVLWIVLTPVIWGVELWMLYSLLNGLLQHLPGVLGFSHRLLRISALIAFVVGAVTARTQLTGAHLSGIDAVVATVLAMDRAVSTAALILLAVMLLFVLWFPVQMPRNLLLLNFGLVLFFAIEAAEVLFWAAGSEGSRQVLSALGSLTPGVYFLFCASALTRSGEERPVRAGHAWDPEAQQRLLTQLEAMNTALARGSRR